MSLTHFYRTDSGDILEITDYVRLYTFETTMQAEEGSHGTSVVTVDDPDGSLTIGGHRLFYSMETAATGSNAVTYVGYTADRDVNRGPYRNGVGRVWDVSLVDVNTVLERRILTGSSANRPAETDVARMQWLFGTEEADIIDNVTDLVDVTGAVAMDAVDYRGQRVEDVANDCANASGKNYFVTNIGTFAGSFFLWYGFASSELYSSPIRLSNALSDVDETWTFAISEDTKLIRDPSRVYSGVYLTYDGGTANSAVYVQSAATANLFALKGRDVQMDGQNIKSLAKATARATRYLGDLDTEEDRITTSYRVPAAKVNFLREGMRVPFKATHLPGYDDFVWLRVLARTVKQESEEFYWVTVELSSDDPQPVAPTGESGFAVLYSPVNTHTGAFNRSDDVVWGSTGDAPSGGYPTVPKFGLLDYITSGGEHSGILVGGTGTVDVYAKVNGGEVMAAGPVTARIDINKNGSTVASASKSATLSSGSYWSWTITASGSGIAVAPGDVLSVHYSGDLTLSGRWPKIPAGAGSIDLLFRVEGTLV
jgi:hypothetical protein